MALFDEQRAKNFLKKIEKMSNIINSEKSQSEIIHAINTAPATIKNNEKVILSAFEFLHTENYPKIDPKIQEKKYLADGSISHLNYFSNDVIDKVIKSLPKEEVDDAIHFLDSKHFEDWIKKDGNLNIFDSIVAKDGYSNNKAKLETITDENTIMYICNNSNNLTILEEMIANKKAVLPPDKIRKVIESKKGKYTSEFIDYINNSYPAESLIEMVNQSTDSHSTDILIKHISEQLDDVTFDQTLSSLVSQGKTVLDWGKLPSSDKFILNSPKRVQKWVIQNFDKCQKVGMCSLDLFDKEIFEEFFEKNYEFFKAQKISELYTEIISELPKVKIQYLQENLNRYLNLFLVEKEFVNKCDIDLLTKFISMELKLKIEAVQKIQNKESSLSSKDKLEIINSFGRNSVTSTIFLKIIQKAYGDKAVEFLKKRPGLCCFENIPNMKLLDSKILSNFRDGFVQDLFSYNFPNIDEFLKVLDNEKELELFKKHYGYITKIFGENCESMEMAFNSF